MQKILVWDWPVRLGHWLMVGGFVSRLADRGKRNLPSGACGFRRHRARRRHLPLPWGFHRFALRPLR
jgi:hypothetical protein